MRVGGMGGLNYIVFVLFFCVIFLRFFCIESLLFLLLLLLHSINVVFVRSSHSFDNRAMMKNKRGTTRETMMIIITSTTTATTRWRSVDNPSVIP